MRSQPTSTQGNRADANRPQPQSAPDPEEHPVAPADAPEPALASTWRIAHSEYSKGWGGQEHRVVAELTGFANRGSSTVLWAPASATIVRRARRAGIACEAFRDGKLAFAAEVLRLTRELSRRRIQILNTHSSRDGWLLGLAGRLARVPLLVRTRHIDVDYPNRWLSRHAFTTFADHVLTTSERIRQHFLDYFGLAAERVSTVPTGIDLARFEPDGRRAALPNGRDCETPVIGMVSVLRSWKGHETFLQAALLLRKQGLKARWVIVGDGPIRKWIETWIGDKGLSECVTLLGHREDVPDLLRAMDVLVIPSTGHEGIPQIGLQALACRTPAVGSDAGGIPEIIRPGETGRLFRAGDASALADTLRATFQDRSATQKMAARGRSFVEGRYSLAAMLDALDGIYRRCLA